MTYEPLTGKDKTTMNTLGKLRSLLGTYPSSTIAGIGLVNATATALLLDQITWKPALAGLVGGVSMILIRQISASTGTPVSIQNAQQVTADTVQLAPGTSATVQGPGR